MHVHALKDRYVVKVPKAQTLRVAQLLSVSPDGRLSGYNA